MNEEIRRLQLELQSTQQALSATTQMVQGLLNATSASALVIVNEQGNIQHVNSLFVQHQEEEKSTLIGSCLWDQAPFVKQSPNVTKQFQEALQQVFQTQQACIVDDPHASFKASFQPAARGPTAHSTDGPIQTVVLELIQNKSTLNDKTASSSLSSALPQSQSQQDIFEAALKESEERHRLLFETMMQGVVYQNSDRTIIMANPSAERILGLTMDQMMGRTNMDPRWKSIHEDGSEFLGHTHPSAVALSTGKSVLNSVMGVFHPVDEKYHWIVIDAFPRFQTPHDTEPFQVYTTFTDITERKDYEVEILKAKEKAQLGDKLKSAFLANMSHEIRTPLNGILGSIELALQNGLDHPEFVPENVEGLQVAMRSGRLLISIIEDILDLSKIEAGQMDMSRDPFPIRALAHEVCSIGKVAISQRNKKDLLRLTCQIDPRIGNSIYGDFYRLQQVLNNLISNAVKFTEQGSVHLDIRLSQDDVGNDKHIVYTVQDTGKGIAEDDLELIFAAFRQVDFGDTRKHGGTGLGLTISKKLVDMMGGNLMVQSSRGEGAKSGSTFSFAVPYDVAPEASGEFTMEGRIDRRNTALKELRGGKVLIAEDDPVSRRIAKRMLEKAGFDVVLAEDGLEAVSQYQDDQRNGGTIDLILMDVQMTHMGGLEATEVIRGMEKSKVAKTLQEQKSVPIVALSAGAMKGDRERGLAAGMTDYLTKPVKYKELLETLKEYVGKVPGT